MHEGKCEWISDTKNGRGTWCNNKAEYKVTDYDGNRPSYYCEEHKKYFEDTNSKIAKLNK